MSQGRVYIDGVFYAEVDARIPVSDRGFLYGDGLFETLRTYNLLPFMLREHLDRLLASCLAMGIRPREGRSEFASAIDNLVRQLGQEAYLRIAVTRGSGFGPWPREKNRNGRTVIVARPLAGYPQEIYERGLKLVTSSVPRNHRSQLAAHKTGNYLDSILARREAADEGADEALMLNTGGRVAELSAANIFAVSGETLLTPALKEGPLPGITRALVIRLAGEMNLGCKQVRMEPGELLRGTEAFATNSILEVCPVSEIDGVRVGRQVPGPVTARIQDAYREEVASRCR